MKTKVNKNVFNFFNIDTNKDLLNANKFDELYKEFMAYMADYDNSINLTSELTIVLMEAGIPFLKYMRKIPQACFASMTIDKIDIPDSIEIIENDAFAMCPLTEVHVPEGVKEIRNRAFNWTLLTDIYLPSTLKVLGSNCFDNCTIHYNGSKEEWKQIFGTDLFWLKHLKIEFAK